MEFNFIKYLFRSNVVFSQRNDNVNLEPRAPSSFSNFWHQYSAEVEKWQSLILRMYKENEAIKRMMWMTLIAQKRSKELSSGILAQKGTNLTRNKRQGNNVAHLLLPNLVLQLDEVKREVRSNIKIGEGEDPLVCLFLRFLCVLIPRALRVRKKTKKTKGFHIAYSIEWRSI